MLQDSPQKHLNLSLARRPTDAQEGGENAFSRSATHFCKFFLG